jgi:hypothetical protein
MANIKPDPRENRPKAMPGRTDAWLRRNDPGFVRKIRQIEKKEGRKRAAIPKTVT